MFANTRIYTHWRLANVRRIVDDFIGLQGESCYTRGIVLTDICIMSCIYLPCLWLIELQLRFKTINGNQYGGQRDR